MLPEVRAIGLALEESVRMYVEGKSVAIAFSGGLDSGLIASIAMKYADGVSLYTVGTEDSYDLRMSRAMAKDLGLPLNEIRLDKETVIDDLIQMFNIAGTRDRLMLSFETPLFNVCKKCKEDMILVGQGADELFAGYAKYVGLGHQELRDRLDLDFEKLMTVNLAHEAKVARHFGKRICYPYLDATVVMRTKSLPIEMMAPMDMESRKMVLREIATGMGFEEVAKMRKKAAQYGSGTSRLVEEIVASATALEHLPFLFPRDV